MAPAVAVRYWADPAGARVYVTVRASPDPLDITANLRAPPLVVVDGRGYQVINADEQSSLRAPLFVLREQPAASQPHSADAA